MTVCWNFFLTRCWLTKSCNFRLCCSNLFHRSQISDGRIAEQRQIGITVYTANMIWLITNAKILGRHEWNIRIIWMAPYAIKVLCSPWLKNSFLTKSFLRCNCWNQKPPYILSPCFSSNLLYFFFTIDYSPLVARREWLFISVLSLPLFSTLHLPSFISSSALLEETKAGIR